MKLRIFFVLLLLLGAPAARAGTPMSLPERLTPEALREACYNYGAVNTVRLLTAEGGKRWAELMAYISSGEQLWIMYVPLFASGTDAGYATQLSIALAEALPKNPQAVLSLEYAFVSLRGVCSLPFIEPNREFIQKYAASVAEAMREITDPYMQDDKNICLTRLKTAAEAAYRRMGRQP